MYYELYIDIFLIVNIIIDYIVLSVLKKVLNLEGGKIRRIDVKIQFNVFQRNLFGIILVDELQRFCYNL